MRVSVLGSHWRKKNVSWICHWRRIKNVHEEKRKPEIRHWIVTPTLPITYDSSTVLTNPSLPATVPNSCGPRVTHREIATVCFGEAATNRPVDRWLFSSRRRSFRINFPTAIVHQSPAVSPAAFSWNRWKLKGRSATSWWFRSRTRVWSWIIPIVVVPFDFGGFLCFLFWCAVVCFCWVDCTVSVSSRLNLLRILLKVA